MRLIKQTVLVLLMLSKTSNVFDVKWAFFLLLRLLQISSFNGKMNALNEVNKVISSVSYYTHRHNPEEEEWLTAERMAVSRTRYFHGSYFRINSFIFKKNSLLCHSY